MLGPDAQWQGYIYIYIYDVHGTMKELQEKTPETPLVFNRWPPKHHFCFNCLHHILTKGGWFNSAAYVLKRHRMFYRKLPLGLALVKMIEGWRLSQKQQNCQFFSMKRDHVKKARIVFQAFFRWLESSWNIIVASCWEFLAFLQAAQVGPENGQLKLSSVYWLHENSQRIGEHVDDWNGHRIG